MKKQRLYFGLQIIRAKTKQKKEKNHHVVKFQRVNKKISKKSVDDKGNYSHSDCINANNGKQNSTKTYKQTPRGGIVTEVRSLFLMNVIN